MDLKLAGRVALVTGASAGIGRGIASALAAEGVRLIITARRSQLLDELAEEIVQGGGERPVIVPADLTSPDATQGLHATVVKHFGRLDILVNNAGGSRPIPVDASEEQWEEALTLNFRAIRRLTHALLPLMQEQGWGRIINVTGTSEPRGLSAATAAKGAVHAWAKGLSREVGRFGITINSIQPGRIMSEQVMVRLHPSPESRQRFAEANIPLGYFGEPEDVGGLVAFLASPRGRYITGTVIPVDGGLRYYAY